MNKKIRNILHSTDKITSNTLIHSLKLTEPLKMDGWNTTFLLGWPIFSMWIIFFPKKNKFASQRLFPLQGPVNKYDDRVALSSRPWWNTTMAPDRRRFCFTFSVGSWFCGMALNLDSTTTTTTTTCNIWARVDQLLVLGMGDIQPLIGNPYHGYTNPYGLGLMSLSPVIWKYREFRQRSLRTMSMSLGVCPVLWWGGHNHIEVKKGENKLKNLYRK